MNPASAWRKELAQQVSAIYAENPKVRAVLLAGSTARGLADAHSDIELDVFWVSAPSDAERRAPLERTLADVVDVWPFEQDEWSEAFTLRGLRFDLSSFLVTTVDRYLTNVIDAADIDPAKQFLLSHVRSGVSLVDKEERVGGWKAKANAYSEGLARAMVKAHLTPHRRWAQRRALAEREDLICLQDMLVETSKGLLAALCGLNRVYLSHPAFKWLGALVHELELAPVDLEARLAHVFHGPGSSAIPELERLLLESCTLIARHLPGAGGERHRELFIDARPTFDSLPRVP